MLAVQGTVVPQSGPGSMAAVGPEVAPCSQAYGVSCFLLSGQAPGVLLWNKQQGACQACSLGAGRAHTRLGPLTQPCRCFPGPWAAQLLPAERGLAWGMRSL